MLICSKTFYRVVATPNPEMGPFTDANFMSASERWGLSQTELEITSGKRSGTGAEGSADSGPWNFWGFRGEVLSSINSIPMPGKPGQRFDTGHWTEVLTRIDVLLQQSGLSYDELREILEMRFVNTFDNGAWIVKIALGEIDLDDPPSDRKSLSSDLSLARLVKIARPDTIPLADTEDPLIGVFRRIHQFARLWRRLGWPDA